MENYCSIVEVSLFHSSDKPIQIVLLEKLEKKYDRSKSFSFRLLVSKG